MPADNAISLQDLTVYFHKDDVRITAVSGVSFDVPRHGFVSIIGPSGCGKSTILNCVAGLERPSKGAAFSGGKEVKGPNADVGYLTQRDALLPWRTVMENVRLPFEVRGNFSRLRRGGNEDVAQNVQAAIDLVGLRGFENHYPNELSGGMLKRASLAQMFAASRDIVLMDEPFGALDAQLKLQMHGELMRIWHETKFSAMFVTHDLEEAIALSDVIIMLAARPGRIKRVIEIDLPRPRDPIEIRFEDRFRAYHEQIWSEMETPAIVGEEAKV
jgi:NitT/TauT family transport system ATP-binding protein